jgi:hypothetical protein
MPDGSLERVSCQDLFMIGGRQVDNLPFQPPAYVRIKDVVETIHIDHHICRMGPIVVVISVLLVCSAASVPRQAQRLKAVQKRRREATDNRHPITGGGCPGWDPLFKTGEVHEEMSQTYNWAEASRRTVTSARSFETNAGPKTEWTESASSEQLRAAG